MMQWLCKGRGLPVCRVLLTTALVFGGSEGSLAGTHDPSAELGVSLAVHDRLAAAGETSTAEEWSTRIATALETDAAATFRVTERTVEAGPQDELAWTEPALRDRARNSGADAVIIARVSRLGGRASLDLRVLALATETALARHVLAVDHPSELTEVVDRAAGLAVEALRGFTPATTPALADPNDSTVVNAALDPADAATRVREVAIRGNRRIDADAVRAAALTQPGVPYSRERLSEDVRRIHSLGFFRDVQVLVDPSEDGVRVEFVVEEHPVVRRVTLSGNENLSGDDITERMTLTVGATVDYPLLIQNAQRIEVFYQSRGYYLAQVGYEVSALDDDSVAVNFDVAEGKLLRLREIGFEGNEHMDDDELLAGFSTKPWGWMSFVTQWWDNSGMYAEPVFYEDMEKVRRRYLDAGFIRARMSPPQVEMDEAGLRVSVRVDEGPQFKVGEVGVLGDASMDRERLMSLVDLAPGQIFSRSTLSNDVERLRTHYADLGYYQAEVRPLTRVNPETLTVECNLEVEKGELFFVDRIDIGGNNRTRDFVVRRELSVVEGALYSSDAVRRSRARLRRLGFFEEVSIDARPVEDDRVAIDIGVVERPTGTFNFGIGFGTTEGFLVNGAIHQDNLFGKGYGLDLDADLGTRSQRGKLLFSSPRFFGTPAALGTGINFNSSEFVDFEQSIWSFNFDLSYPLDEGETRLGTGYQFSDRDIEGNFERATAALIQREEFGGRSTTSLMALTRSVDTRDDIRLPREGQKSGLTFEVAGLGGVNQFLRFEARTTRYMPFAFFGLDSTFVVNSRAGYVMPLNSLSDFDLEGCDSADCQMALADDPTLSVLSDIDGDLELNLSERYFLGGVGSFQLRGFERRAVGPRRARLEAIQREGGVLFRPFNTNPACNDPAQRPGLSNDACNDLNDTETDDFDDLDLTDVIGGNKMMLANFELRVPVSEELGLSGIAFFDVGNAWSENESMSPTDLRFSTGLGAQWLSPFGPIVVYMGVPLNPLEDEKASVFEFSLGGTSF